MEIRWSKLNSELNFENSLLRATVDCVNEFADKNSEDETFYAFAYDIEFEQGHFGLCLSSVKYLKEQVANQVSECTEDDLNDIKYCPGNWKYQAFNKFRYVSVKNIWDLVIEGKLNSLYEVLQEVEFNEVWDSDKIDKIYSQLIFDITKSIETVIERLKKENCFRKLKRSEDFKIYWIHMQEGVDEIMHRINR